MCRRVFVDSSLDELIRHFTFAERGEVDGLDDRFPRYNGYPKEVYPIIIRDGAQKSTASMSTFAMALWNFTPSCMRPSQRSPSVIRCEGIAANTRFRPAYQTRRCLIPVSGFFEWDTLETGRRTQPYAIAMKDELPFALAGISEIWRHPSGIDMRNFAVLTCAPNEMMATIHDRMPVILHRNDYDRWLSPEPDPADLLKPFPAALMSKWPVARRLNNDKRGDPEIIAAIEVV
ncbi:SOS response-associated peptidase [Rhizobium leguminosarum]|uniref:SOS response-associated peptidase n=1 Tax=Rhizobium leguminosarum TaxID=384 RepID=UPI001C923F1B|nr:SOS response-associated peptidase [Rhizobium leguminosarum]MBY2925590.1 SOS response-associated peptidase [Rhizobium leguminosarum]MBY2936178.1 SOS response-associated peptidase [Rhizobium leguminosarum]